MWFGGKSRHCNQGSEVLIYSRFLLDGEIEWVRERANVSQCITLWFWYSAQLRVIHWMVHLTSTKVLHKHPLPSSPISFCPPLNFYLFLSICAPSHPSCSCVPFEPLWCMSCMTGEVHVGEKGEIGKRERTWKKVNSLSVRCLWTKVERECSRRIPQGQFSRSVLIGPFLRSKMFQGVGTSANGNRELTPHTLLMDRYTLFSQVRKFTILDEKIPE